MVKGWKKPLAELAELSGKYQKLILFTEFGYRACDHTAEKPWESETDCQPNPTAQANAYAALNTAMWPQPWFAGGFVWKWHMADYHRPGKSNHHERDMFSPQGKPAEGVLKQGWSAH